MQGSLPDQFIKGLSSACLQGRAQIVPDPQVNSEYKDSNYSLVFYLDGAHSPESMEMCARWFSHVTKKDGIQPGYLEQPHSGSNSRKVCVAVFLVKLIFEWGEFLSLSLFNRCSFFLMRCRFSCSIACL